MAIFLERISSAPLNNDDLSPELDNWFSAVVDSLNETIEQIQDQLNGLDDATFATRKTSAEITTLIGMNAFPVLAVGSMWFDTTINKLKVLVTAAVPGVSNGITETVTSV